MPGFAANAAAPSANQSLRFILMFLSSHRQNFIQRSGYSFQLVRLAGIPPDFRGDETVIPDLDQRRHNRLPVHVAFQQIRKVRRLAAAAELEILEVNSLDALA